MTSQALPNLQSLPIGVASSPEELKSSETVNQNPCFLPSVASVGYFVVRVRRKVANTMVLGSMAFRAEISTADRNKFNMIISLIKLKGKK